MGTVTLGPEIKRRRLALRLSQQSLADLVGMDRPHLSKIERAKIEEPQQPLRGRLLSTLDRVETERGIARPQDAVEYHPPSVALGPVADLLIAEVVALMTEADGETREMIADHARWAVDRQLRQPAIRARENGLDQLGPRGIEGGT